jgi:hypothetical protein
MSDWLRRVMDWWTRPTREKREVQEKLTRFDKAAATYQRNRFMAQYREAEHRRR